MGEWLKVNGESIYGTRRNPLDERPEWGDISVSKDGKTLYLHILEWPESGSILVEDLPVATAATYLANGENAEFVRENGILEITLPVEPLNEYDTVVKVRLTNSVGE
jgi:alpha-L-fucosidase